MFDNKSDSALNKKDKDALVYRSVTGDINRLTREQLSNEKEFLKWKYLSDDDYEQTETDGRGYYDNVIASLDDLSENAAATPSVEELLIDQEDGLEREKKRLLLLKTVKSYLTKVQYRRALMYYGKGMKEQEIARTEGIRHQNVSKSIIAAKEKFPEIKKIFRK